MKRADRDEVTHGGVCFVVFLAAFSVTAASLVAYFRWHFDAFPALAPAFYATVCTLLGVWYLLGFGPARTWLGRFRLPSISGLVVAIGLCFVLGFSGIGPLAGMVVLGLLSAVGLFALVRGADVAGGWLAAFAVLGAAFAAWSFVTIGSLHYSTVIAPEEVLAGVANRDTLYHSSIMSMFREFALPSVGLDGLELMHYHTFMHMLLGVLSSVASVTGIAGLALGNQIVLVPLLFFSLCVAASVVGVRRGDSMPLLAPVLALALIALVGTWDWKSFLISETYALGLSLVLLSTVFLRSLLDSREPLSLPTLVVTALFCFAAAAAKISAGVVVAAALGYVLLRSRQARPPSYLAAAAAFLLVASVVRAFFMPVSNVEEAGFYPFHFLMFGTVARVNVAVVALGSLICLVRWVRGIDRPWQETMAVMLAASFVPPMILEIGGGSGYYFLNIGTWLGACVIASECAGLLARMRGWVVPLGALAAAICAIAFDLSANDTVGKMRESFDRVRIAAGVGSGEKSVPLFDQGALAELAAATARLPLARMASAIRAEDRPGVRTLVYVNPQFRAALPLHCQIFGFFVPAYVGLPMLMGLPPASFKCDLGPHYGFPDYPEGQSPETQPADASLCEAAVRRGFERVLVAETPDSVRPLDCPVSG